jgi:hypothetical protein
VLLVLSNHFCGIIGSTATEERGESSPSESEISGSGRGAIPKN